MNAEILEKFNQFKEKKEMVEKELTTSKARYDTLVEQKQKLLEALQKDYKIESFEQLNLVVDQLTTELQERVQKMEQIFSGAQ